MADERTSRPTTSQRASRAGYDWQSLTRPARATELEDHYRQDARSARPAAGLLGLIFRKAQNKIQDPAKLRRLIVDLIGQRELVRCSEPTSRATPTRGCWRRTPQDTKSGAGQYFTPRALIQAIVDVVRPKPGEAICDPACGTGGFLLAAHDYSPTHYTLDHDQKKHLRYDALRGGRSSTARRGCAR